MATPLDVAKWLKPFDKWADILKKDLGRTQPLRSDEHIVKLARDALRVVAHTSYRMGAEPQKLISDDWESLRPITFVLDPFLQTGNRDDDDLYPLLAEAVAKIHRLATHQGGAARYRQLRNAALAALERYLGVRGPLGLHPELPVIELSGKQKQFWDACIRFVSWEGKNGRANRKRVFEELYPPGGHSKNQAAFRSLKREVQSKLDGAICGVFIDLERDDIVIKL